jgi:hypothetical protein
MTKEPAFHGEHTSLARPLLGDRYDDPVDTISIHRSLLIPLMISRFVGVLLLLLVALPLCGETWYVRHDGGTRYSNTAKMGECDGKSDARYPGKGVDQLCAFNDVRSMWMDGGYGNSAWVMRGGDTLVIEGCAAGPSQQNPDAPHCRIGWDSATAGGICQGVNAFWGCSMPPPPSGTASQHTRILGACVLRGTCNTGNTTNRANLTQLYGGFSVGAVMYLSGSQYVDVEGLEITSHNGKCTRVGYPQYPKGCSTDRPVDDYANWGIITTNTTSNITLQDLYIHGLTTVGITGPIGGSFTMTRVAIDFNAFAGWNFDDGHNTPDAPGSSITASYVTMEGNGCLEEYPIVHKEFPALSCWDTNDGGFGDSWSGQDTKLDSFTCDHCVMAYNTKDGFIGPHTLIHYLKITNSESYGNMGQQWKWGTPPGSTTIFVNNLTVGNCRRMAEQLPGAPPGFNRHLGGFCRAAGDVISFFSAANSTVLLANNTTVGYSATMFDLACQTPNACGSTHYIFRNNVVLGFLNPKYITGEVPGLFYFADPSVKIIPDHDLFFGLRSKPCPYVGHADLICATPAFVNQPASTLTSESQLDNFNFHPRRGSPAIGHGAPVNGVTADYFGVRRPDSPSIGAIEP